MTLGSNPSRAHPVQSPRDLGLRGTSTDLMAAVGGDGGSASFVVHSDDIDDSDGAGSGDIVGGLDAGGGVYDDGQGHDSDRELGGSGTGHRGRSHNGMPVGADLDDEEEEYMDLGLDDFGGLDLGGASASANSDDAF